MRQGVANVGARKGLAKAIRALLIDHQRRWRQEVLWAGDIALTPILTLLVISLRSFKCATLIFLVEATLPPAQFARVLDAS
jgi:hypothetical protein